MVKKKTQEVIVTILILFLIAFIFNMVFQRVQGFSIIIIQVIYYLILIFITIFTVKKCECRGMKTIGLYTDKLNKQILIGVGIFSVLSLITLIPLLAGVSKQNVLNFKPKNIGVLIYFIFYDICFVGFGEELVFRGYFLERMKEIFNSKIWAILISSILFGLWHYPTNHNIMQVISATIFGVLFSICKLKIKNCGVVSLAIAHGLNDAFIILLGYFLL